MTNDATTSILKNQRKQIARAGQRLMVLATTINDAIPELGRDIMTAALYLDNAEQRLLSAETRIEAARRLFADANQEAPR